MYRILSILLISHTTAIHIIRCMMIIVTSRNAVICDMRTRKRDRVGSRVIRSLGRCVGIVGPVPS